jgi:hypothetical protein
MSTPVGVFPAALAGHAAGSPPSDVMGPPEALALDAPEPPEEPAPPLPVARGPDPLEGPEPLEAPLPVTGAPEPLGRELHAHPTAPTAIMQAKRGGRVLRAMRCKWTEGSKRLAAPRRFLVPAPTRAQVFYMAGEAGPEFLADIAAAPSRLPGTIG